MGKAYRTASSSRRHPDFDYTSGRAYFVTLCVQDRQQRFGTIQAGELRLSAEGLIVAEEWRRTEVIRPGVALDEFVVMPDHMHAIIALPAPDLPAQPAPARASLSRRPRSLGSLIAQFKATTTRRINLGLDGIGRRLWQRNYHDRIIRNGAERGRIRRYIALNPVRWAGP
jgi:REP element-mobilizing transposase RayT